MRIGVKLTDQNLDDGEYVWYTDHTFRSDKDCTDQHWFRLKDGVLNL